MNEEKKGIVRMLAVTFAVMLAVPLAYRVWITFNPPAPSERLSLAEFFDKATANRSIRLLKTPLDQWTNADRTAEPKIAAWLEAHSKIVLPWEWSSEAQKKDPKGYRKAWKRLLSETESLLKDFIARIKELKRIDRELLINQTLHIHLANQIAAVERNLITNPLPATVTVENLVYCCCLSGRRNPILIGKTKRCMAIVYRNVGSFKGTILMQKQACTLACLSPYFPKGISHSLDRDRSEAVSFL